MICFYHRADLDGQCSGAIIKQKYPDCKMVGVDYGDPEDQWMEASPGEEVFVVDFSFQPFSNMVALANRGPLVWIDHHKTAIDSYEEAKASGSFNMGDIRGRRDIGVSACEMSWEYFNESPLPTAVFYLGRWDVWDWQNRPEPIQEFQLGMQIHDTSPGAKIWDEILVSPLAHSSYELTTTTDRICNDGEAIKAYLDKGNEFVMKEGSFKTTIEGYKVIALNTPFRGSEILKSEWSSGEYDVMMVFAYLGNSRWRHSLYSEGNVNVGEIAKIYGGGGHANAAGFTTDSQIFS
ncbi:MAG: hypothetical protein CMB80_08100 [Flammeovirgaceae bacterium]|nr:hypothetical protein [Flammeovirgaceae bacterium]|tara:strand:- start:4735 stop:5610 length:876 start_codon:yes stop_codon:yes gene_type:complete